MTTEFAQATFIKALKILQQKQNSSNNKQEETILTIKVLTLLQLLSKSANSVPRLRGRGLREGLELAQEVINYGTTNLKIKNNSAVSSFLALTSEFLITENGIVKANENDIVKANRFNNLNTKNIATEIIKY